MRLYERLRPKTLSDIIGQPQVTGPLSAFLLEPYPNFFLFEGSTGLGKSATAAVLSDALTDPNFGAWKLNGAKFNTEAWDKYFGHDTPFRYRLPENCFHCLRIEELERLPTNVQNGMKDSLDDAQRDYKLVVIATSNTTAKLEKALLHRFQRFTFDAGPAFAKAFNEWLAVQWLLQTGDDPPEDLAIWGYELDRIAAGDSEFSARLALDRMEQALMERTVKV
jgi:replication-associated recombination protein RarA